MTPPVGVLLVAVLAGCTTVVPPPAVVAANCPVWSAPEEAGKLNDRDLHELSGLIARPGGFWAHNDSGDSARLFALDDEGHLAATVDLGASAVADDWEDLAVYAPEQGPRVLFIADTGDNQFVRESQFVYHLDEPQLPAGAQEATATATAVRYSYPDGAKFNAETLFVDPRDGALYLVTKSDEGVSHVFVDRSPLTTGARTWEALGTLVFGGDALPGSPKVTSGDMSADGTMVAIRTYTAAYAWRVEAEQTVMDAISGPPCVIPAPKEDQGESIAFLPDGDLATVSEGRKSPVWVARRTTP